MNIFVSYGHHDDYRERVDHTSFVRRLVDDLGRSHKVWWDAELMLGDRWPERIQDAIDGCDLVLFVKTPQSVREGTYCLNEITRANEMRKRVAVIALDDTPAPIWVSPEQRMFMQASFDPTGRFDEQGYAACLALLMDQIERTGSDPDAPSAAPCLFKFNEQERIERILAKGVSEEETLRDVERGWLDGDPVFCYVSGSASSGKSTLCASIYSRHAGSAVAHLFRFNDYRTADLRLVLQSLIASTMDLDPGFAERVRGSMNLAGLDNMRPAELMDMFTRCLDGLGEEHKPLIVVLDALDEIADPSVLTEIVTVLIKAKPRLAGSVKVLATSRTNNTLRNYLMSTNSCMVVDSYEMRSAETIRHLAARFFEGRGIGYDDAVLDGIVRQSGGDYYYMKFLLDELLARGTSDVRGVSFPLGMRGVCQQYFDRVFGDDDAEYRRLACPVLEALTAVKTPVGIADIAQIARVDHSDLHRLLMKMESFIDVRDDKVAFVHKSLYDWLASMGPVDKYAIDVRSGAGHVCDYVYDQLRTPSPHQYALACGFTHLLEAEQWERITALMGEQGDALAHAFASFVVELAEKGAGRSVEKVFRNAQRARPTDCRLALFALDALLFRKFDMLADRIVGIYRDPAAKDELRQARDVFARSRDNEDMPAIIEAGTPLLQALDDDALAGRIGRLVADAYRKTGRYEEARELYEDARDRAYGCGQDGAAIDCELALADLLYVQGLLDEEEDLLESLADDVFGCAAPGLNAFTYHRARGNLLQARGMAAEAVEAHRKSLNVVLDLVYPVKQMSAYDGIAEATDDLEEALSCIGKCRDIHRNTGVNGLEDAKSLYIEAYQLLRLGSDAERALALAQESVGRMVAMHYTGGEVRARLERGKALHMLGMSEQALDDLVFCHDYYRLKGTRPRYRLESWALALACAEALADEVSAQRIAHSDDLLFYRPDDYPFQRDLYERLRRAFA